MSTTELTVPFENGTTTGKGTGDYRKDFAKTWARRCLYLGAYLMPMLSFRILGKSTATTESGLTISDLFFFFAIVLLAISVKRRKLPPTRAWYVGVALIVVSGLFATIKADSWAQSLFVVARMVFVLLMWQWTVRHLVDDDDRLHAIITAYILGAATSALVAIVQLEFHQLMSFGTFIKGRSTGLAKHPDDTGSLLSLGLAFSVGLAMYRGRPRRWCYALLAVVIAIGLVCTGSVSGMLTGLGGAVVALVLGRVTAKQVLTIVAVIFLAYFAGVAVQGSSGKSLNPIQRFTAATGSEAGGSNSVSPRVGTWHGAWRGIINSPLLGHGLDVASSITYTDPTNNTPEPTHDFVLMGWYQGGFFFLVGELICIAEGIRRMFLRGKRDPFRAVLFGGAFAVLTFAAQAPAMYDRYFWFPFVLATTYPWLPRRANGNGNGNGSGPEGLLPHPEFAS